MCGIPPSEWITIQQLSDDFGILFRNLLLNQLRNIYALHRNKFQDQFSVFPYTLSSLPILLLRIAESIDPILCAPVRIPMPPLHPSTDPASASTSSSVSWGLVLIVPSHG